jgi:hypothetical protein
MKKLNYQIELLNKKVDVFHDREIYQLFNVDVFHDREIYQLFDN